MDFSEMAEQIDHTEAVDQPEPEVESVETPEPESSEREAHINPEPPKKKKPKPAQAAKKQAKKTPAKSKPVKSSAHEKPPKNELRKGQIKILKALSKKDNQTRPQLVKSASVDSASVTGFIGPIDPEKRRYNDEKYFPTLITLGLVKAEQHDVDGKDTIYYKITAKGKSLVSKL